MEIHSEVSKKFLPYMQKLIDLHKQNLKAVYLFGSAVGKDFTPKISDINSIFIFTSITSKTLELSSKIVAAGLRKRIAAPYFMTKEHINESTDVFPIEFLDMKENSVLLFGEDILKGIKVNNEHLRLFCEQQLKGRLIKIRQAVLETGGRRNRMEVLLKESLNSLFPVLRNCLRLKGVTPPVNKEMIVREVSHEFNLEHNLWLELYEDRKNDGHINGRPLGELLEQYLRDIEKLATWVDRL
jgi:predicted nucleotidyltransferase